jgi:ABC-type uncharacterized transport system substrate-binding protein
VKRREFIRLLGGALAAQAIPANAQELRVLTVGVLIGLANDAEAKARTEAFQQGLERQGWSVGQNLRIEYRYAEGDSVRMQALAKEMLELKPDCILAHSTPVVTALMQATRTIPIVFVSVTDPVGSGFVASMGRPAGNMTGFTIFPATITGKYLSMLKEMVPQLVRVAIIYNPDSAPAAGTFFSTPFADAAKEFNVQPITAQVRNPAEIESAIAKLGSEPNSGLIVMPDTFTAVHRKLIISLAAQFRIPTIYPYRYFCRGGWPFILWGEHLGRVQACRGICQSRPSRCEAGGSSGASADEIRTRGQSQGGEGSRHRDPEDAACRRRSGD